MWLKFGELHSVSSLHQLGAPVHCVDAVIVNTTQLLPVRVDDVHAGEALVLLGIILVSLVSCMGQGEVVVLTQLTSEPLKYFRFYS